MLINDESFVGEAKADNLRLPTCSPYRHMHWNSFFTDSAQSEICAAGMGSDSWIRRLQLSRKPLTYGSFFSQVRLRRST